MAIDTQIDLAGVKLRTPVITASGCFASGKEMSELVDLNKIGAITVKSMTLVPWTGKPTPRMAETASGMLNAIGLQNKGVEHFLAVDLPWLISQKVPVIASIAGNTVQEFMRVAERLRPSEGIVAIEVNISCPNLEDPGNMFAHDAKATNSVVAAVHRASKVPVFVKLSPNVTNIVEIAEAAVDGGAAGLSLINTIMGMAIDIETARPRLAATTGGLSGPAIKPIALKSVFEVHRALPHVPIIGMGGIMNALDAVEFILAGATAVAVGTANFINPRATVEISEGIAEWLIERGLPSISAIRGQLKVEG